jgi:hypothetical protein
MGVAGMQLVLAVSRPPCVASVLTRSQVLARDPGRLGLPRSDLICRLHRLLEAFLKAIGFQSSNARASAGRVLPDAQRGCGGGNHWSM